MVKDIEKLISELTLEEKISLLTGENWWHTRSIERERVNIPSIRMSDGPYGIRIPKEDNGAASEPGTCFPVGVSMGATWNTELITKIGEALGEEARARGIHILLGPTVNIHRSPLAGRNFESFSEDPFLTAQLALAYVKGVQSRGVGTSVKHFALNNSEFERMTISSEAGERAIREIYLPAFELTVKEGRTWTVMSSYNKINGKWASENSWLLSDILKKEWRFEGIVISDWFAFGSTVGSAEAGLDLEMPGPPRIFGEALVSAMERGEVSESIIDEKIRRILKIIERSGGNTQVNQPAMDFDHKHNRRLLRAAAEEAIVLLKNERSILPLDLEKIRSLAVIGPNAGVPRVAGAGSSKVTPFYAVTPLTGLAEFCGDRIKINYEQGCTNHRLTPLLDPAYLSPDNGVDEPGLMGTYYANNDFEGEPAFTRVEKLFIFNHGYWVNNTTPGPGLDPDCFSVRWKGLFKPPVSGKYRFGLLTSGFCRISLNGKILIEKWKEEPPDVEINASGERIGEIELKVGQSYALKVEYCQNSEHQDFRRLRLGCEVPLAAGAMNRAVQLAAQSDLALVFVGLTEEYDAEFQDRENMDLPGDQVELIKRVSQANPKTIVVLSSGSPVSMEEWVHKAPAILQTGYIGQEAGHAIADVLFGRVNPSGKLTETYPLRLEDNPAYINYPGENGKVLYGEGIFVGYRYYDMKKIAPAFPFGHGLSYTGFQYDQLLIHTPEVRPDESVHISVDITNTGKKEGKEVVQLYVRDMESSLIRPPKELKGFNKVNLEPGEKITVNFELTPRDLSFYNPDQKEWICEPGEFEVMIGGSSANLPVRGFFIVQ